MIVGTAGHIDHGKTSLVRALTGVDTDRLPEERARGISIDLGYAYAPATGDATLGFVDVPGHEKFVHTMVAGATGIDFVLLVIAADDGIMPQTREHVAIVSILGVREGAIALTKADAVDAARLAECEREARAFVADTALREAPVFAVSSRTGVGVDALQAYLRDAAARFVRARGGGRFRLAVDRSFTLPGIGTVVTGTVYSGEVHAGDRLQVAPSGLPVRVRAIHAQGRPAEAGIAGQRCALNLAGVGREDVRRGDWIVDPAIGISTDRFDATLDLARDAGVATGAEVHVHVGAAHAFGRVVALGNTGLVQVVLRQPVAAWRGDRYVVRDASATHTLGGGIVLDPCRRFATEAPTRIAVLRARIRPRCARGARQASPSGADARSSIARATSPMRPPSRARSTFATCSAATASSPHAAWSRTQRISPSRREVPRGPSRSPRAGPLAAAAYRASKVSEALYRAGRRPRGDRRAARVRARHSAAPRQRAERRAAHRGRARHAEARRRRVRSSVGPRHRARRRAPVAARVAMVRGEARRDLPGGARPFLPSAGDRRPAARALDLQAANGHIAAAAFRDATGLGRKRAIQILEFFDRVGFTRRVRDARTVRPESSLAVSARSRAPEAESMS